MQIRKNTKNRTILMGKRGQLIFLFTGIVLIISLFVYLYFPSQFQQEIFEQEKSKALAISNVIGKSLESPIFFEDIDAIKEAVNGLEQLPEVTCVQVLNKSGKKIYHKHKQDYFEFDFNTFFENDSTDISENGMFINSSKIIFHSNEKIGVLRYTKSLEQLQFRMETFQKNIAIISLLIFILGGIGVLIISHFILQPLAQLTRTSELISAGDRSLRADDSGKDEISFLASAFNTMLDKLYQTQYELELTNSELEKRVLERTQELNIIIQEKIIAENQIKKINLELEERVLGRTKELNKVADDLRSEIKERKILEDKLVFSDKVLKKARALVIVGDENGDIIYISDYAKQLLGYEPKDLLGENWWKLNDTEYRNSDKHKHYVIDCALGKRSPLDNPYELPVKDKDGNVIWISWQDTKGENNQLIGVGHDITNQRLAKVKLEEASIELENALSKEKELSELKSRFISVISHEYRTPLTVIYSSAEIINELLYKGKIVEAEKYINKITYSVNIMVQLLEDVLTIGKSDTGKLTPHYSNFDFIELMNEVIEEIQIIDNNKHTFNFDNKMKFLDVRLDKKFTRQIVQNLISNATKYSSANTNVDIVIEVVNNNLILTIQDYGIGIAKEDLKFLFEPFHRGKNVGSISGTGLGMSIIKRCALLLKGNISVESELNKGLKAIVTLPIFPLQNS